jgi:hypothetical protein
VGSQIADLEPTLLFLKNVYDFMKQTVDLHWFLTGDRKLVSIKEMHFNQHFSVRI